MWASAGTDERLMDIIFFSERIENQKYLLNFPLFKLMFLIATKDGLKSLRWIVYKFEH